MGTATRLTLPFNKKVFLRLKLQEMEREKWTLCHPEDGPGLDEESAILAGPHLRLTYVPSENAFILPSFLKSIFAGC